MSMIPIPQETFRSAMKADTKSDRFLSPATNPLVTRGSDESVTPYSRFAPLLILITCVALWVGIWTALAAAMGWL